MAGVPPLHPILRNLQENKTPIFEREGWQSQPSLSKIGILLIRRSLIPMNRAICGDSFVQR